MLQAKVRKDDIASVYRRIAPTYDLWGRLTESKARVLAEFQRVMTFPSEVVYGETMQA